MTAVAVAAPPETGGRGDALYLSDPVIPAAGCGGWTVGSFARRGRLVFAAALHLEVAVAYPDIRYRVLRAAAA